uniref:Nipped-B protein n=1 Tax=Mesocestoides corti TaxID=53468 RepID=A0A5K3FGU5_MESCO
MLLRALAEVLRRSYPFTGHFQPHLPLSPLPQATCGTSNRDEVFNTLMFFAERALLLGKEEDARLILASGQPSNEDVELGKKAIAGLSFLTNRHDYLFCSARLQTFFTDILAGVSASFPPEAAADLQCIILDCLTNFLVDEEKQMLADDSEWATRRKQESLKELGDRREGHGSAVAQVYLPTVLEHCIISPSATVRAKTLSLISTVLRQGLVHPVHTIACLVCLQTDPEAPVRTRATQQLQEADKKFPGFLALKAEPGIRIGFRLQRLVASSSGKSGVVIRGATVSKSSSDKSDSNADSSVQARPLALNHTVYSLLQGNRQHRRSLITSLVTLFDLDHTQSPALYSGSGYPNLQPRSSSAGLASVPGAANAVATEVPHDNGLLELIYICDQLAHFPYKTLDEINYLAHSIDLRVSTLGSGVARALHDCMISSSQLKTPAAEAAVYDRKVTNLIEDAEAELFAKSTPPAESGPIERKVLDRMNRPAVADRRRAFRAQVIRSAPACLLLMSVRKYLEEAYDVTSSKLSSYSPGEEKQWQKPISAPSGRALQLGAFRRLVEIPAIVEQCATDPTWPPVTANLEETLSSPGEPSDKTILRLALLVHRQLLSMDDEGAIGTATATESCSQSTGPDGDALQAPPTVKKSSPAHRESEKSRTGENKPSTSASKLHNDQRAPAKAPTKVQPPPSKHRKIDDIDEANGSLSSLSDSSPVRKAPSSRQQSSVKSGEKRKQPHPSGGSSSSSNVSKSTKHPTKPNREAPSASLSKYHTSIPKKDPSKSGTKKRLHRVTEDDELSSLSSLDDSPPRPPKKTSPPPAPAPAPKKTEKPAVVRPKYDLAPLPGTPDIRTQQEQRRKMKALASKKAMTKHLAAGGSEKKLNRVSQQPPFVQKESFRRELKKPAEACESDVEISSVSSVSTVSTPSSSTCSSDS